MNNLTVMSYNIWFDQMLEKERLESLIYTIHNKDPDIVCLQEVKPYIFNILISILEDYDYYPKKLNSYGTIILSKYPITKCFTYPYKNSLMNRGMIVAKIDYPFETEELSLEKIEIVIANTHFESIFSRIHENTIKLNQYKMAHIIINDLYNSYENVILCADSNILPNEEHNFIPTDKHSEWQDGWKQLGDNTNYYTYDSYTNPYLKSNSIKYRSRLDRVIYRCNNCVLTNFDLIKKQDNGIEISDHYGLFIKFEIKYLDK